MISPTPPPPCHRGKNNRNFSTPASLGRSLVSRAFTLKAPLPPSREMPWELGWLGRTKLKEDEGEENKLRYKRKNKLPNCTRTILF